MRARAQQNFIERGMHPGVAQIRARDLASAKAAGIKQGARKRKYTPEFEVRAMPLPRVSRYDPKGKQYGFEVRQRGVVVWQEGGFWRSKKAAEEAGSIQLYRHLVGTDGL